MTDAGKRRLSTTTTLHRTHGVETPPLAIDLSFSSSLPASKLDEESCERIAAAVVDS